MACGTIVGTALEFGIVDDEASLVTQSVSVTRKMDKKEARNGCGEIVSVAYYNKTASITITGLGNSALTIGSALVINGSYGLSAGTTYIDEIAISKQNEAHVESTVSATHYFNIT